jgi:hypothetical protein
MERAPPSVTITATICAMGSPGSVDPKMKIAKRATSAATTRRQPQPVIGLVGR